MLREFETYDNSLDFEKDIQEIKRIKKKFTPCIIEDSKNPQIRSYDPALAYWNFDRFGHQNPEKFKAHEQIQMETFLGERFGVTKRPAEFVTKENGEVYSKDFPNQPFDIILQRGIDYRKQEGSDEEAREQSELTGWKKIREKLLDSETSLGTEFVVISGPGVVDTTNYPDNYIDLYVSKMDFKTKKRSIERKRFISGLSYDKYISEFKIYKSDYFDNFSGPIDAWFLENPLIINQHPKKLFVDIFAEPKFKMPEKEFEEIIADCMPFIDIYINLLCVPEEDLNPEAVISAYNAVLVLVDKLKKKQRESIMYLDPNIDIYQRIEYLGQFEIEDVLAGCGRSGGFKRNRNKLIKQLFGNSVAKFGIEDDLEFECQNGHKNTREHGKYKKYCSTCGCDVSCGIASAA